MAKRKKTEHYVQVVVARLPVVLSEAIARDAIERGSSNGSVAAEILSETFGLNYQPAHRSSPVHPVGTLRMRVPEQFRRRLYNIATRQAINFSDLARGALADHYGLSIEDGGSGRTKAGGGGNPAWTPGTPRSQEAAASG